MKLENFYKQMLRNAIPLDAYRDAEVSHTTRVIKANLICSGDDTRTTQEFFDTKPVFSLKNNSDVNIAFDSYSSYVLEITVYYGKGSYDIFNTYIGDVLDFGKSGYLIFSLDRYELIKSIRPNKEDISEGDKFDRILKKIDNCLQMIDKFIELNGLQKTDESELADEDFEDDEEDDDLPCTDDEAGKDNNPVFDGYRCTDDSKKTCADDDDDDVKGFSYSIEGNVGPDGVMKFVKTDSDGKSVEKTVKLEDMSIKGIVDIINGLITATDGSTKLSDLID